MTHPPRDADPDDRPLGSDDGDEGVEGNARLTGTTAAVLLVLFAAEGVTVLRVRSLLTAHVVLGMLVLPPVLLKVGSTLWRFARYYLGAPEYRRKGPPPAGLRLLGPLVVVLTLVLLASGIALLLAPTGVRPPLLQLHQVSFVLWFCVMTVHVLAHIAETARLVPRDLYRRTRRQVRGAGARQWAVLGALALGMLLAMVTAPLVGPWLSGSAAGHGSPAGGPTAHRTIVRTAGG